MTGDVWTGVGGGEPYNTVELFEPAVDGRPAFFMGIIEAPEAGPPLTRIAFRAGAPDEVRAFAAWLPHIGAQRVELSEAMDDDPAVFFEDPLGTRLEICARR